MKVLIIDSTSPDYPRLCRLLDEAGRGRMAMRQAGVQQLLAPGLPAGLLLVQTESPADSRTRLCVRVREGVVHVPVVEVRYFLAEHKYVWVRTARDRLLIPDSLRSLADEFAGHFVRIHRNALVAVHHLTGLYTAHGQCRVSLAGIDEMLAVSRRRLAGVRRLILEARESPVDSSWR